MTKRVSSFLNLDKFAILSLLGLLEIEYTTNVWSFPLCSKYPRDHPKKALQLKICLLILLILYTRTLWNRESLYMKRVQVAQVSRYTLSDVPTMRGKIMSFLHYNFFQISENFL